MSEVLVVITGPTASGKTGLAIKLAKKYNGEIISADSRAIFREINIASAKPTPEEMDGVVHWGIDLASPGERFTSADFKKYADEKIQDILNRGKTPFLVGGTGLYIDSVLNDYEFGSDFNPKMRLFLNNKSVHELQELCRKKGVNLPENHKNKRYLIRAIEKNQCQKSRKKYNNTRKYTSIVVGITTNKDVLRSRINNRIQKMLDDGIVDEAIYLAKKYGWDSESMTTNAYPIIRGFVEGDIDAEQLEDKLSTRDWRLAKRQIAFMKRNNSILWKDLRDAEEYIVSEMEKIIR